MSGSLRLPRRASAAGPPSAGIKNQSSGNPNRAARVKVGTVMITRSLLIATFLTSLGVLNGAEPPVVFSGMLTSEGKTYVALTDSSTKGTRWVRLGEEFNGYSVVRYDSQNDAVFLKKGSEEIRVPLALAKTAEPVQGAVVTPTPVLANTAGIAAAVRSNLRQLATAAQELRTTLGVASVSYNDLVGPGKPIPQLTPVAGETYSTLNFGPDVTAIGVTTSDGATITLQLQPSGVPDNPAAPALSGPVTASSAGPMGAPSQTTAAPPASNTPATTGKQPPPPAVSQNVAAQPTAADEKLPATGRQPPTPSYTIQGGDTLQSIATANGVSVQQLQELNPTLHGSSLRPGETIRIR